MTDRLGVIGDPVAHSLSPLIHNPWLQAAGIDARYEAIHVPDGQLPDALDRLYKEGVVGLNVTLPHKQAALAAAASASEAASRIGAANTLSRGENGTWLADNTDAPGVLKALEMAGLAELSGCRTLVLGAGGSARAVVYALSESGAEITLLNRTLERAGALLTEIAPGNTVYGPLSGLPDKLNAADLVINTTSGGHSGQMHTLTQGGGRLFLDISYGPAAAAQLAHADEMGWQVRDGLTMLVAQAAESFRIWFGQMPDTQAALVRCRQAVEARA